MKKITPEELVLILSLHAAWLRGEMSGASADLRDANLGGADLRDANLGGADLRDADLRDADLRDADLRGANLGGADLRGANLGGANLRGANLHNADLRDADLRDADLRGANLRGAYLRGADLRGCEWDSTDPEYGWEIQSLRGKLAAQSSAEWLDEHFADWTVQCCADAYDRHITFVAFQGTLDGAVKYADGHYATNREARDALARKLGWPGE